MLPKARALNLAGWGRAPRRGNQTADRVGGERWRAVGWPMPRCASRRNRSPDWCVSARSNPGRSHNSPGLGLSPCSALARHFQDLPRPRSPSFAPSYGAHFLGAIPFYCPMRDDRQLTSQPRPNGPRLSRVSRGLQPQATLATLVWVTFFSYFPTHATGLVAIAGSERKGPPHLHEPRRLGGGARRVHAKKGPRSQQSGERADLGRSVWRVSRAARGRDRLTHCLSGRFPGASPRLWSEFSLPLLSQTESD